MLCLFRSQRERELGFQSENTLPCFHFVLAPGNGPDYSGKSGALLTPKISGFLPSTRLGGGRRTVRRVTTLPPCDHVKLFKQTWEVHMGKEDIFRLSLPSWNEKWVGNKALKELGICGFAQRVAKCNKALLSMQQFV